MFLVLAALLTSVKGFSSVSLKQQYEISSLGMASSINERPLYDPLNLYGANSKERKEFRIRSLEPELKVNKPVLDPMNLYPNKVDEVDKNVDMSDALPFMPRPTSLKRELAGDVGFDPFNFADTEEKLIWQRKAELKHARVAMLAVAGWMLSELFDKPLASMFNLDSLLSVGDRAPSLLNGGLDKVNPLFWVVVLSTAGLVEIRTLSSDNDGKEESLWDPLGLYPISGSERKQIEADEINNGRLAMLAFVGFGAQEFMTNTGIVNNLMKYLLPHQS